MIQKYAIESTASDLRDLPGVFIPPVRYNLFTSTVVRSVRRLLLCITDKGDLTMHSKRVLFLALGLMIGTFSGSTSADDDNGIGENVRYVTFTDTTTDTQFDAECPVVGSGNVTVQVLNVGDVAGDLQGTITVCLNAAPDPATTGLSYLSGFFAIEADGVIWSGPFDGLLRPPPPAPAEEVKGDFVGTGTDGTTMRGDFTLIAPGKFLDQAVIIGGTDDD